MKFIRRMYDWVLGWADTPYGAPALFLIAFAESSFFPIPPDVLLIALCLGVRERAFRFAAICAAGSILGGLVGYGIGWGLWGAVDEYFFTYVPGFSEEAFARVQDIYQRWDFWFVFVAAFTPVPYKVITITAGVFGLDLLMFTIATIIGRSARFFAVAALLYAFGEPIGNFIDKRFNLLTIAFTILLFGGFYLFRVVLH